MENHHQITSASARGRGEKELPAGWFGQLEPGAHLDGLTVVRVVGEGAMASLYLVRDGEGRERVIKVPRHAKNIDPVSVVAFENELRLAPHLADFRYAYMPQAEGTRRQPYLSMDYIRGQDLWSQLKQRGPLGEAETLGLGLKIAHAVSRLHHRRIVHLDLKLSNVMLTPEGEVRLIDFGLANHLDLPDIIFESFREPKGTPAYIAPEQLIGVRDEPRSDLFSVGVMLFELSTGVLPYTDGGTVDSVIDRIKSRPMSPRHFKPELTETFVRIVTRCLRPNPDDRFPSMRELAEALQTCLDELAEAAPAVTPATPSPPPGIMKRLSSYIRHNWLDRDARLYADVKRWAERHRQRRGPPPYRILAAVKLGRESGALDRAVLQQALQLARTQPRAYVTVLNAVNLDIGMANGEKEAEIVNTATLQARDRIRELLDALNTDGVTVNVNVVASNQTVDAIQQHAREYGADLAVIGCRPMHPLALFLHGRTGYRILTTVACNVFVVHAPAADAKTTMALAAA